jgi:hypothetical protein
VTTEFSVREIPFSRYGAWFCLSPVVGLAEYADDVHLVSHRNGMHPVLSFVPLLDGERVDAVFWAPDRLPGPRLSRACGSPEPVVFLLFKSKFPLVDRQRRRAPP